MHPNSEKRNKSLFFTIDLSSIQTEQIIEFKATVAQFIRYTSVCCDNSMDPGKSGFTCPRIHAQAIHHLYRSRSNQLVTRPGIVTMSHIYTGPRNAVHILRQTCHYFKVFIFPQHFLRHLQHNFIFLTLTDSFK